MWKYIILFISAAFIFSSCEDNMFLKSEKKMKADLQGTWQREFLGDTAVHYSEQWIFTEDNLYTVYTENDPPDWYDNGAPDSTLYDNRDTNIYTKFKIDAKTFKAYLKFQLVHGDTTRFVDKWQFITLDKGVLYLAADDPTGSTVLQLEFYKVK